MTSRRKEIRKCINCNHEWTVVVRDGKQVTRIQLFCKECVQNLSVWERKSIILQKFPDKREQYLQEKREDFLKNYKKQILHRTKLRALDKHLEFNLEESDIIIPKMCPILEVPLKIGTKGEYEYSPSIDRIDNSKGYIRGNIQVISKKANSMKNSATRKELETFCKNILRYSPNNIKEEDIESKDKEP